MYCEWINVCQLLVLSLLSHKHKHNVIPAADPAGGAYSAPPDPIAGLRVPTSKEREGKGRGKQRRTGGKKGPVLLLRGRRGGKRGREGKGKGREEREEDVRFTP